MTTTDDVQRDLGRMEGEIEALKTLLNEVRADVKEIKTSFHQMQGGTKVLLVVAAALGAGLNHLISWFIAKS